MFHFWLFDASVQADITYEAENINIWDDGDTEYTEHEIYNAVRGGTETFSHVPADASKKMDDVLMESIEPFNYQDAVPFQSAYLAGYVADRYDVDKEETYAACRRTYETGNIKQFTKNSDRIRKCEAVGREFPISGSKLSVCIVSGLDIEYNLA